MSGVNPGALPPPVYSPVVRPVVGNESAEQKVQALPPVEQPDQPEQLRPRQQGRGESDDHCQEEGEPQREAEAADGEKTPSAAPSTIATAPSFRILPDGNQTGNGSRALDAFQDTATDPGRLLDQHI